MLHSLPHRVLRPLVVAFVAFLLAAVASASLLLRMDQYRLQETRARASDAASDHADELQRNIERALSATYALAALVRQGNGTVSNFDAVGRQMLQYYPGVSSLSLAPGGIVSSVVPLAGSRDAEALVMAADAAMYSAKEVGNSFRFWEA
jgi:sensor domain CHASE-containing protein